MAIGKHELIPSFSSAPRHTGWGGAQLPFAISISSNYLLAIVIRYSNALAHNVPVLPMRQFPIETHPVSFVDPLATAERKERIPLSRYDQHMLVKRMCVAASAGRSILLI